MKGLLDHDPAYYLRVLVDKVPSLLAYWDRDLRCRFTNRAYERWFGAQRGALIGKSMAELLGPELFALNEPHIRGALAGQRQVFERAIPGHTDPQRYSLATYIPDVVDGTVMGFIVHITEVTQLKQAETTLRAEIAQRERAYERLRHSESALREAQRVGQVGSWEYDAGTGERVWSEQMYRIFGCDATQPPPVVDELPALYTAQSWSMLQAAVAKMQESGEPCAIELEYVRPDGQTGWIEAHCEVVRGERGETQRMRGTCHEITLRRRMDDARVQLQVAEAANRNKTDLLSRVSHDLRTPLGSILGFAQLSLGDSHLEPKQRQWIELIVAGARHMLELVDELLDMSAAEAGQIVIRRVEVDVLALIEDAMSQAAVSAQLAGIRLVAPAPSAPPPRIFSDPKRLKQVVGNLLSNAIKYSRPGGVVTLRLLDLDDRIELTVQDGGVGMSAEQLQRLFVPFERLGAERTAVAGTGLGLAHSKRLVESMGGTIVVESRPGEGSSFTVTLPKGR